MKIGISISVEMAAAIDAESKARNLTQSQIVRNIVARNYGLPSGTPRKPAWVPDPLLAHAEIPKGANI